MSSRVSYKQYPWWVKVVLWRLPSRGYALACIVVSLLASAGMCAFFYRIGYKGWYCGLLLLGAPLLYWLSVRWVDRNGSWERGTTA
jgi:hypothetical protein